MTCQRNTASIRLAVGGSAWLLWHRSSRGQLALCNPRDRFQLTEWRSVSKNPFRVVFLYPTLKKQIQWLNPLKTISKFGNLSSLIDNYSLTHWGRVMHICVSELTIIGSDNGLSPGRRQAIIWTIAGILWIGPLGTNFNEILIEIYTFSFRKMHLKMSSGKWRPFCLGLNVLMFWYALGSARLDTRTVLLVQNLPYFDLIG